MSVPFIFPVHDAPHDYFRYTGYGLSFLLDRCGMKYVIHERNNYIESMQIVFLRGLWFKKWKITLFITLVSIVLFSVVLLFGLLMKNESLEYLSSGYVVIAEK